MLSYKAFVILLVFLFCIHDCSSSPLTIATLADVPFVIVSGNNSLSGYSIDLWESVALYLKIDFKWMLVGTLQELLGAVNRTEINDGSTLANASISSISITQTRIHYMDFSQPITESGLQIMAYKVKEVDEGGKAYKIATMLFSRLFWEVLGLFFVLIMIFTHIFYLIEKKPKGVDAAVRASYVSGGLEDSAWWASSILFTGGSDLMPMTACGRFLTFLVIITSCILVAVLQAAITAQLTVSSLSQNSGIQKLRDLSGLNVGTVKMSTADLYLMQIGEIPIIRYDTSTDMLEAFSKRRDKLAAVFYDFPTLQYYAGTEGESIAQIVGPVYQPQQYGIALPTASPFRKQIDIALLHLQEAGTVDLFRNKWFPVKTAEDTGDISLLNPDSTALGITWGLVAASCLLIFLMMLSKYILRKRQINVRESSPANSESWEALESEMSDIQDNLQNLANKLHVIKVMAYKAKHKHIS